MKIKINGKRIFLIFIIVATMTVWLTLSGKWHVFGQTTDEPTQPAGQAEVTRLETLMAESQADEIATASLSEKLAIARSVLADQVEFLDAQAIQAAAKRPTPQPVVDDPITEGIFEGHDGLFRSGQAEIINRWQGVFEGENMQVFAGAAANSNQSLLIIVTTSPDRLQWFFTPVPAPFQAGALRIVEAQNGVLSLLAEDGSNWVFDIASQTYRASKDD